MIIFATLLASCIVVCAGHDGGEELPRLLLISFDGFRWDYLDFIQQRGFNTPAFSRLIAGGVRVASPGVKNSFITKTMPNHYTIVTGLYQEVHGIIANMFYDPVFNVDFDPGKPEIVTDIKWWNGTELQKVEPIWVTNEAAGHGRASGVYMWTACNVKGFLPSYFKSYNRTVPFEQRADTIVSWFKDATKPVNLAILYMDEPDHAGHQFGPESKELIDKVIELDKSLNYLLNQLEKHELLSELNIIITSDHGMEPIMHNIYLSDFINSSLYMSYGGSPVRHFVPKPGQEEKVYEALKKITNTTVYRKDELPESLHYRNNRRVAPFILFADIGFQICDEPQCIKKLSAKNSSLKNLKGDHGWNNSLPSMHPIFIAYGPAFRKNFLAQPFETVSIYELLCHLLRIKPRPNNGSLHDVKHILMEDFNADINILTINSVTISLWVCFAALIFGVVSCWAYRYLRRKRSDGRWKPLEMEIITDTYGGNKPLLVADEEEDELA